MQSDPDSLSLLSQPRKPLRLSERRTVDRHRSPCEGLCELEPSIEFRCNENHGRGIIRLLQIGKERLALPGWEFICCPYHHHSSSREYRDFRGTGDNFYPAGIVPVEQITIEIVFSFP